MLRRLQKVEGTPSGSGRIDIFAFGNRDLIGGGVDYQHRISESWSAVAAAEVSKAIGAASNDRRTNASASAGLRYRW